MSIAGRLAALRCEIDSACRASGRLNSAVRLVGVVKRQTLEAQLEAYDAGLWDFAHSYADEAAMQRPLVAASMPEARWHFIGRIQSKQVRRLSAFDWSLVHSVDRTKVAHRIASHLGPQGVLVQVRLGGEPTKSGVEPDQLESALRDLAELPELEIRGLMTLPPPRNIIAPELAFERLRTLSEQLRSAGAMPQDALELSMGMSGDFREAIAAGATLIRIGTSLFGPRSA